MRREPLILGGGPAGCAAAIALCRAGYNPLLLERSTGPADKVCGDFLGGDSIALLHGLGVDPAALGAAPIDRVRVSHGRHLAASPLPFAAMGLSRRVLDEALLQAAAAGGTEIRRGTVVRRLTRLSRGFAVEIAGAAPIEAETVFLATGKHDLRDWPRPGSATGAVGMKTYLKLAPQAAASLSGVTELMLFRGGYAGLQEVDHGCAVLCVAVQRGAFRQAGGDWSGIMDAICASNARFGTLMHDAAERLQRPLAVAGVPYGLLPPAFSDGPGGLYRLGDQAAVIPSLTGDGIAIALHTGIAAARAFVEGSDPASYHRRLRRDLYWQMRLAVLMHRSVMSGHGQALAIKAAAVVPGLLRLAAHRTRLPEFRDQP